MTSASLEEASYHVLFLTLKASNSRPGPTPCLYASCQILLPIWKLTNYSWCMFLQLSQPYTDVRASPCQVAFPHDPNDTLLGTYGRGRIVLFSILKCIERLDMTNHRFPIYADERWFWKLFQGSETPNLHSWKRNSQLSACLAASVILLVEWPCETGDWQCCRLRFDRKPVSQQHSGESSACCTASSSQRTKRENFWWATGWQWNALTNFLIPHVKGEGPGVRRSGKTLKDHVHGEYGIFGLCNRLDEEERMRFLVGMFIEHGMKMV